MRAQDHRPSSMARCAERRALPAGRAVTVRKGDSLWGIAAQFLPADASNARIAAAWPRWHRANAPVIGTDADLIRPGQILTVPGDENATTAR